MAQYGTRVLVLALVVVGACAVRPSSVGSLFASQENQTAQRKLDAILHMPGYTGGELKGHYGGYITVDEQRGRNLYYYLVESANNPQKDPLILWLNGGPGCSSFDGFVQEHGPFKMEFEGGKDGEGANAQRLYLRDNAFGWHKAASIVYVDSPAGVGMSYSDTDEDYHTNDEKTIADMHRFLRHFVERHPQFQDVDFYVAGESYAGVYVPLTAQAVLHGNDAGAKPRLNLAGYMVGNPVSDERYDGRVSQPEFARDMAIISDDMYHAVLEACGSAAAIANSTEPACKKAVRAVNDAYEGINMYSVLEECYQGGNPYTGDMPDYVGPVRTSAANDLPSFRDMLSQAKAAIAQQMEAYAPAVEGWKEKAAEAARAAKEKVSEATRMARTKAGAAAAATSKLARKATRQAQDLAQKEMEAVAEALQKLEHPVAEPFHRLSPSGAAAPVAAPADARVRRGLPAGEALRRLANAAPQPFASLYAAEVARAMGANHTPGCLDQREMWAFCNDAAVREAIHARPISDIGAFDECTNLDRIFYERQNPTVVAVHMELVSRGVKALVYSGDHDAVISNVGTERWIKDARLPRTHAWEAWHTPDGQVAGFCEHYRGLTYATVRGAGHAVPELKPEQALLMIQRFMKSENGLVRDTVAAA